jgi:hypothetical protein
VALKHIPEKPTRDKRAAVSYLKGISKNTCILPVKIMFGTCPTIDSVEGKQIL